MDTLIWFKWYQKVITEDCNISYFNRERYYLQKYFKNDPREIHEYDLIFRMHTSTNISTLYFRYEMRTLLNEGYLTRDKFGNIYPTNKFMNLGKDGFVRC